MLLRTLTTLMIFFCEARCTHYKEFIPCRLRLAGTDSDMEVKIEAETIVYDKQEYQTTRPRCIHYMLRPPSAKGTNLPVVDVPCPAVMLHLHAGQHVRAPPVDGQVLGAPGNGDTSSKAQ